MVVASTRDRTAPSARDLSSAPPRHIQIYAVAAGIVVAAGLVISAHFCAPVDAALIAALLILCYIIVPTEPDASGGVAVFHTPLYYGAALLFAPASVFMGISIGTLIGRAFTSRGRVPWRIIIRAATAGLHVTAAAVIVTVFTSRLDRSLAMLIALTAAVATGLVVNTVTHAFSSSVLYGLPWRPELIAKLRDRYYDQAMELVWAVPVVIGMVVLPRTVWPAVLAMTVPTSLMNWRHMVGEKRRTSDAMTRIVAHTLPTDDPAVRELAEELAVGVMVISPDGMVLSRTPLCLRVLGRSTIARNTPLAQLCVPDDFPHLLQALHRACSLRHDTTVTLRVIDDRGAPRRVRLGLFNRLYDPAVRGVVATVLVVEDGAPSTQRLQTYVNQALAAEVLGAQEDERTRVAQELEDLRQVVVLQARPTTVPAELDGLQRSIADIQRALRAPAIDHLGLEDAIREHCAILGAGDGAIVVHSDFAMSQRFDHTLELAMYRIVQDAVALCRRARLEGIKVNLKAHSRSLTAVIESRLPRTGSDQQLLGRPALMLLGARAQLVGGTVRTEVLGTDTQRIIAELPTASGLSPVDPR